MKPLVLVFVGVTLLAGLEVRLACAQDAGRFVVRRLKNPPFRNSEIFRAFEDYHAPRVKKLREKYKLDKIIAYENQHPTLE